MFKKKRRSFYDKPDCNWHIFCTDSLYSQTLSCSKFKCGFSIISITHLNPSTSSECSSCLISLYKPLAPPRIYSLYLHLTSSNCWVQTLKAPARLSVVRLRLLTHLTVEQRVVVPPHLRVNIVEVPLKAFTLQTLPQCNPLRDVSIINTMVLQEQTSH